MGRKRERRESGEITGDNHNFSQLQARQRKAVEVGDWKQKR